MYSEAFETDFLLETETVYRTESLRMMRDTELTVSYIIAVHIYLSSYVFNSPKVSLVGGSTEYTFMN